MYKTLREGYNFWEDDYIESPLVHWSDEKEFPSLNLEEGHGNNYLWEDDYIETPLAHWSDEEESPSLNLKWSTEYFNDQISSQGLCTEVEVSDDIPILPQQPLEGDVMDLCDISGVSNVKSEIEKQKKYYKDGWVCGARWGYCIGGNWAQRYGDADHRHGSNCQPIKAVQEGAFRDYSKGGPWWCADINGNPTSGTADPAPGRSGRGDQGRRDSNGTGGLYGKGGDKYYNKEFSNSTAPAYYRAFDNTYAGGQGSLVNQMIACQQAGGIAVAPGEVCYPLTPTGKLIKFRGPARNGMQMRPGWWKIAHADGFAAPVRETPLFAKSVAKSRPGGLVADAAPPRDPYLQPPPTGNGPALSAVACNCGPLLDIDYVSYANEHTGGGVFTNRPSAAAVGDASGNGGLPEGAALRAATEQVARERRCGHR